MEERLSRWSSDFLLPSGIIFEHSIKDDDEFSHNGHQCHLLFLTRGQKLLIEGLHEGVIAGGSAKGLHIHRSSHGFAPSEDTAIAS